MNGPTLFEALLLGASFAAAAALARLIIHSAMDRYRRSHPVRKHILSDGSGRRVPFELDDRQTPAEREAALREALARLHAPPSGP